MAFTPHTNADIQSMLENLGIDSIDELFDEIPDSLKIRGLDIAQGQNEMVLQKHMHARAKTNNPQSCFLGGGAYEHFIPASVWQITARGEFMTAYTPYQAEASQGSLQTFYEYQTMMAKLMAMDVSNASLYDGASSLGEAVLMAARCQKRSKSKKVLVPKTLHPHYRHTTETLVTPQNIELAELAYNEHGITDLGSLKPYNDEDIAAVVVPQPNFFGQLEEMDQLTQWAHDKGAVVIAVVNPIAASWLSPPGEWGEFGADIACGEGQPLGIPLSYGGPYYGFMCCRQRYIRHMPGRLIGRTVDEDGRTGYTMTLQPREQHIRRSKATSNICTNQGLMVIASTIYMALMGNNGLRQVAINSHGNACDLYNKLTAIKGVEPVFSDQPFFNEFVIQLPTDSDAVLHALNDHGIEGGIRVNDYYPELENALLVCATETKSTEDIDHYAQSLATIIKEQS